MPLLEVRGLKKSFGKKLVFRDVSFEVESGILAVLGPNASGKTTLMKCIMGLVIPDEGRITFKGMDISSDVGYRAYIGYMPQIAKFPENLTLRELLDLVKDIRSRPSHEEKYLEMFGLKPFLNSKLKTLSGGTLQKVNATLTLMFENDLYMFDEPTAGFDPLASTLFKDELVSLKEKGKAVVFTSHVMSEVEELADELILLLSGELRFRGSPQSLKEMTSQPTLERAIAWLLSHDENPVKAHQV